MGSGRSTNTSPGSIGVCIEGAAAVLQFALLGQRRVGCDGGPWQQCAVALTATGEHCRRVSSCWQECIQQPQQTEYADYTA